MPQRCLRCTAPAIPQRLFCCDRCEFMWKKGKLSQKGAINAHAEQQRKASVAVGILRWAGIGLSTPMSNGAIVFMADSLGIDTAPHGNFNARGRISHSRCSLIGKRSKMEPSIADIVEAKIAGNDGRTRKKSA